jgi:hypothetical protein
MCFSSFPLDEYWSVTQCKLLVPPQKINPAFITHYLHTLFGSKLLMQLDKIIIIIIIMAL